MHQRGKDERLAGETKQSNLPGLQRELGAGRKYPLLGSLSLRGAIGPPPSPERGGGVLRKTSSQLLLITSNGPGELQPPIRAASSLHIS